MFFERPDTDSSSPKSVHIGDFLDLKCALIIFPIYYLQGGGLALPSSYSYSALDKFFGLVLTGNHC